MDYLDLFALTAMPVKRTYVFTPSQWRAFRAGGALHRAVR